MVGTLQRGDSKERANEDSERKIQVSAFLKGLQRSAPCLPWLGAPTLDLEEHGQLRLLWLRGQVGGQEQLVSH